MFLFLFFHSSVADDYAKSMNRAINQAESERALLKEKLMREWNERLSNSKAAFNDLY